MRHHLQCVPISSILHMLSLQPVTSVGNFHFNCGNSNLYQPPVFRIERRRISSNRTVSFCPVLPGLDLKQATRESSPAPRAPTFLPTETRVTSPSDGGWSSKISGILTKMRLLSYSLKLNNLATHIQHQQTNQPRTTQYTQPDKPPTPGMHTLQGRIPRIQQHHPS